ncbi:MAG: hypothetical protein LH472_08855 [Pyrinomonadaceae bacterium]|nr:hypothetical protein [Pyrinomonadaceae bacterium]
MNIESQETLLEKNVILEAINSLRQEMNGRFDKIEARLTTVEKDIEEIKNSQFSFDVRLERVEGMAYESLSIGHNLRADVKILRAEVGAWAKDVMRLEKQPV